MPDSGLSGVSNEKIYYYMEIVKIDKKFALTLISSSNE